MVDTEPLQSIKVSFLLKSLRFYSFRTASMTVIVDINLIYIFLYVLQNGLAEFYEKSPDKNDQSLWPSFGRICLGAAGILALGALLTQKS